MSPQLPPELIGRIIEDVASNLLSSHDCEHRTRAVELNRLSRVDSTFRAFAQRELKRHVILDLNRKGTVEKAIAAFDREDGLLGSTQSIELFFSFSAQSEAWARRSDVVELLKRIGSNVVRVVTRGQLIYAWHFELLGLLPKLNKLHLEEVDFNPDDLPDNFSLSNITHLTLDLPEDSLFEWSILPLFSSSLTHFTLLQAEVESSDFTEYWSRIAPHISHLHLEEVISFADSHLAACTSLLHLRAFQQQRLSLTTLTSPLRTLIMEVEQKFAGPLRDSLVDPEWLPSRTLKRIELSSLELRTESESSYQEWLDLFQKTYEGKADFVIGWDLRSSQTMWSRELELWRKGDSWEKYYL